MSQPIHTYGFNCHLAPRNDESNTKLCDEMPEIRTQFFYCSSLPIDDPLSPVPPPTSDQKTTKVPPKPFSYRDNEALQKAWMAMGSARDRKSHKRTFKTKPTGDTPTTKPFGIGLKHRKKKNEPETDAGIFQQEHYSIDNSKEPAEPEPSKKRSKKSKTEPSTVCPCKGSHLWCRNSAGKCTCTSCPKNAMPFETAIVEPHDLDPSRQTHTKAPKQEDSNGQNTKDSKSKKSKSKRKDKAHGEEAAAQDEPEDKHSADLYGGDSEDEEVPCDDHDHDAKSEDEDDVSCADSDHDTDSEADEEDGRCGHLDHDVEPEHEADDSIVPSCCGDTPEDHSTKDTKDTKQKIANSAEHTKPKIADSAENTKQKLSHSAKHTKQKVADSTKDTKEKLADSAENTKKVADSTKDSNQKLADSMGNTKQKLADFAENTKQKFNGSTGNAKQKDAPESSGPARKSSSPGCCAELERKPARKSTSDDLECPDPEHEKHNNTTLGEFSAGPSEVQNIQVEVEISKGGQQSKRKYKFFNKRSFQEGQADGTDDVNEFAGSDTNADEDRATLEQGDATNETDPHTTKSKVLVAGDGNAYMKTTGLGTTGKPFVKLPERSESPGIQYPFANDDRPANKSRKSHERESTEAMEVEGCKAHKHKDQVNVPVGHSRLHEVSLPSLQMKPIYWSPVHDIAACIYGTWFHKDTMYPVEPAVANQLEVGYRELRCWSQTWNDELRSAIDVGAAGEEKIAHRLWPAEDTSKSSTSDHLLSADPHCAARCFQGEVAAEGKSDEIEKPTTSTSIPKKYPNSQVIYKNACDAYILRPSLQPSEYHGRKPLSKIMKNIPQGIPVVRGFDRAAWEKIHPSKATMTTTKATFHTNGSVGANKPEECPACQAQDEVQEFSDLCLVVHGIGQKLSERMESFHFTHAVNGFRCEMNRELANANVKKVLREDLCGVMVLPVNWRKDLVFEDSGPTKAGDKDDAGSPYTLNDITLPTIPAVRGLICDVMLDIPYYLSKHKLKMIAALIAEANRIYRLWCKNNPGFHKKGRVHLVGHSLGSVMALEILSKQPTTLPAELSWRTNTKCFDFRTTNCFLAGSPAAFFLLLDNARLYPRKALNKPGAEPGDDTREDVVGDVGTFGCIAVDNIYNIMHINDPIAYRLNATVDATYASNLKTADVPNSSAGFFGSFGHAMKATGLPGISSPTDIGVGQLARPHVMHKLPSQVEMAVHDFSKEEIAEKKFCLLNDNGQVDWCLGNRGGMLDNQYINMLSAHSCYWTHRDFIRMLCVEIGRKCGRENTLPNMRARKSGGR